MTRGKIAGRDEDDGALDSNDELLFQVSDAGDRLPEAERQGRIEIELTDPRFPESHAWAYLASYKSGDPPRSNIDYVNYDPPTERIISKNYILGYRKGYMFYNDLIYPQSAGGSGEDFLDRIKFRIRIEFFKGRIVLVRNEESVMAEVQGWIDGPIRVMQSTTNRVKVLDALPPISFNSKSEYYAYIHASPITVRFPFDLNFAFKTFGIRSITADVIGDMPGMVGGKAYTNLDQKGFTYTGHTPLSELAKLPKLGLVWGFSTKKGVGTWFPRLLFPDLMYQFNSFYITDDVQYENPPDDVPGEISGGLRLDFRIYPIELTRLISRESFMLKFETYFAPPGLTPSGAREWLDIEDYPVMVDVHGSTASPKASRGQKKRPGPPWRGGRDGIITDVRDRKISLIKIAFFIGGIDVDARSHFFGERVSDETFHAVHLSRVRSLTNYVVEYDSVTKTRMAMFSKLTLTDGSTRELLGCFSCGWGGADEEGRVIYLSNSQIKRIDFTP